MNTTGTKQWTMDSILSFARDYQGAAVLVAAAELDVFSALVRGNNTAPELARTLNCDSRGMTVLLDALTALGLLEKQDDRYLLRDAARPLLTAKGEGTVLAMLQHQANCLRNWAQLASVVKSGRPAHKISSVLGEHGDQEAFIGAMHNISQPAADSVISAIHPLQFRHLLDVGGASGTWTMAFLRACPESRATLFDLPHVIPMARSRLASAGLVERVQLVPGSFYEDPLPSGADLVWVSAIVHQNSREQNRALFAKVLSALQPNGRIAIRDIIMELGRTKPVNGALFAINMLVATQGGSTFTFDELSDDLVFAGFQNPLIQRRDEGMNAILVATKP
jgi:hypothetical protein